MAGNDQLQRALIILLGLFGTPIRGAWRKRFEVKHAIRKRVATVAPGVAMALLQEDGLNVLAISFEIRSRLCLHRSVGRLLHLFLWSGEEKLQLVLGRRSESNRSQRQAAQSGEENHEMCSRSVHRGAHEGSECSSYFLGRSKPKSPARIFCIRALAYFQGSRAYSS